MNIRDEVTDEQGRITFTPCGSWRDYTIDGVPERAQCQLGNGHTHYHKFVTTITLTWLHVESESPGDKFIPIQVDIGYGKKGA